MASDWFNHVNSESVGAPGVFTGSAGHLISVLDFALKIGDPSSAWEKVFTGTNKAVYRAKTGQRAYLRVDNTAAIATSRQSAIVRGYESMTDVDTGADAFPTVAMQASPSWVLLGPSTPSAGVKGQWEVVAWARGFLFYIRHNEGNSDYASAFYFGETEHPLFPGDQYNTLLVYSRGTSDAVMFPGSTTGSADFWPTTSRNYNGIQGAMMRNAEGTVKSVSAAVGYGYLAQQSQGVVTVTGGNIFFTPVVAMNTNNSASGVQSHFFRGKVPYLWGSFYQFGNAAGITAVHGDTFTDSAGRTFKIVLGNTSLANGTNIASTQHLALLEISNTAQVAG